VATYDNPNEGGKVG